MTAVAAATVAGAEKDSFSLRIKRPSDSSLELAEDCPEASPMTAPL
mgnify:CR=1 FL=1